MICFDNIFDAGCYGHNSGPVKIGQVYPSSGEFVFRLNFNGQIHYVKLQVNSGDPIELPLDGLNEDYLYYTKLIKPDGSTFEWEVDGVTYKSFKFKILTEI